jgi:serine protease
MSRVLRVIALFLLVSQVPALGLDVTTRLVGPVQGWTAADLESFNPEWVQVKFTEGSDVQLDGTRFADPSGGDLTALHETLGRFRITAMRPTFTQERSTLRDWKARGEAQAGCVGPDLSLWFNMRVAGGRPAVAELVNALNALPAVEIAHPMPIVEPAVLRTGAMIEGSGTEADSDALQRRDRTPDFTSLQGYLYDPPVGLDAPAAWALGGGRGEGMKFIDVEVAWTPDHEDFPFAQYFYEGGEPMSIGYEPHGTAVLGEVIGSHNGFGVSGFAPAVSYGVVAIDIDLYPDVAQYFQEALDHLDPGDVWLIELQMAPPGHDVTPMEWLQVNYDVIWTSVWGRGVVCVEAGANGSQNLDDPGWGGVFDRNQRDSGAIMVAAGTPTGRVAESFTNYGSRMDVHAWGSQIVTTGYGDLYDGGTLQTLYTDEFGGTSGASPMIVGSSLCLQGIAKEHLGYPLRPEQLRAVLHDTGIPHLDPFKEIGPRPDLAAAAAVVLATSPSPHLRLYSRVVDDDQTGSSHGNGNGAVEIGESIELTLSLINVGQLDAVDVVGVLACEDPYITVSAAQASFGTIPAGGGVGISLTPFVFDVDPQVPDGHEATFRLGLNQPSDQIEFALTCRAPRLELVTFGIDDQAGGNGNGAAEPGEDVLLTISVANVGSGQADQVLGTLWGGPYLEIDPTPVSFGTVAPGAHVDGGPFAVTVTPACPNPFTTLLVLDLEGAGPYATSDRFNLPIGDMFHEDMENGGASWMHHVGGGSYLDEWHLETYRNHTFGGTTSWKCGGPGGLNYGNGLYAVLESAPFALPAGASLVFWHWMAAHTSPSYPGYCYDGGLVELSLDGGPFELITPEGGYPYRIRAGTNPLPGETPVFSGVHDWEEAVFDLAGQVGSARVRFVFTSNASVTLEGWYVDDVQLTMVFSEARETPAVTALQLHPVRPNPITGEARLTFDLPAAERVRVAVYDAGGRRLRTLLDDRLPAGSHGLRWDGRDGRGQRAPAGVYWARLEVADQRRATRVMVLR